ncbi:FtsX-like permease family protein [Tomitella gaofuii]|uniref:FtsX-like permease family protein n=1 Tax=Tomitella gaofuii TaxID=2760083 RepID=UPI0015FD29B9|nr:FtsX-like permease family protein [Tomitella gaofuii]
MTLPPSVVFAAHELRTAPRSRVLLVAIVLGCTLVVAGSVLGATMQQRVSSGAGVAYERTDLVVRTVQGAGVGVAGVPAGGGITAEDVDRMSGLPGVESVAGMVRAHAALGAGGGVRALVVESPLPASFAWQGLADGRLPRGGAEVALNQRAMDSLGLRVGDRVTIGTQDAGRAEFTVVGALDVKGSLEYESLTYAIAPENVVRALAGIDGVNEVRLRTAPGTSAGSVVDEINSTVPVGWPQPTSEIIAATEQLYGSGLSVLSSVLYGLALIAGLIAFVVLATVVWASLPSRRRTLGMLRTTCATRGQLIAMVALESGAVALVGAVIAIPVGIGLASAAIPLMGMLPGVPVLSFDTMRIPVGSIALVPVAAILGGVLASVVPAVSVARMAPAAAMAPEAVGSRPRGVVSSAALLVSVLLMLLLFYAAYFEDMLFTVMVGLALVAAWVVATPTVCRGAASVAARLTRGRRPVAELTAIQLRRFPGRAAAAGLGATVAAAILALSWVALGSLSTAAADRTAKDPGPDVMVGAYAGGPALGEKVVTQLSGVDGVADVLPVNSSPATLVGPSDSASSSGADETRVSGNVTALSAERLDQVTGGRFPLDRIDPGTAYLPASKLAPFDVGSEVTLRGPDGVRSLRVRYVEGLPFQALVSPEVLSAVGAEGEPHALWVRVDSGTERQDVLDDIRAVAVLNGDLPVSGNAVSQARVDRMIGLARGLATGMLAVAVAIAIAGAALTLTTTQQQRTAEFATLRLLGMQARQLRRLVAGEAWAVGTLSIVAGLALGSVLGAAAAVSVAGALGIDPRVDIPVLPLAILGAVSVVIMRLATATTVDRVAFTTPVQALRQSTTGGRR